MGEVRKQKLSTRRAFVKTSGTEVRIAIRRVVPVDVELVVPVRVRHVAVDIARTSVALLHPCLRKAFAFLYLRISRCIYGHCVKQGKQFY